MSDIADKDSIQSESSDDLMRDNPFVTHFPRNNTYAFDISDCKDIQESNDLVDMSQDNASTDDGDEFPIDQYIHLLRDNCSFTEIIQRTNRLLEFISVFRITL